MIENGTVAIKLLQRSMCSGSFITKCSSNAILIASPPLVTIGLCSLCCEFRKTSMWYLAKYSLNLHMGESEIQLGFE